MSWGHAKGGTPYTVTPVYLLTLFMGQKSLTHCLSTHAFTLRVIWKLQQQLYFYMYTSENVAASDLNESAAGSS